MSTWKIYLALTSLVAGTLVAIAATSQASARAPMAAPTSVATATPAPVLRLRCTTPGTNSFGLTPPLTLVTQPTTIERATAYRNCQSFQFPAIREGYEHFTNFINDNCVIMLQAAGSATYNIIWNTSQTSTFVGTRSAVLNGNTFTVTFTGSITAGLFAGRPARQVFTANTPELVACLAGTGQVPFLISDVLFEIS